MPYTEGAGPTEAQIYARLHHPLWMEHDHRLKVLLMIKSKMNETQDPLEYCWLVRIGFRLAQSLWRENCNSGVGLMRHFLDEGAHNLAQKLCSMPGVLVSVE